MPTVLCYCRTGSAGRSLACPGVWSAVQVMETCPLIATVDSWSSESELLCGGRAGEQV